jgi:transposase
VEQPAVLTVPGARELWGSERTAVANQIRGLLVADGGAIAPGLQRLRREFPPGGSADNEGLPTRARIVVTELPARGRGRDERSAGHDRQIAPVARQNEAAKRLLQGEGGGPLTAPALGATVGDAKAFAQGRQFAAWLGLVPKHGSTGGKPLLGRITKRGNVYLRTRLLQGARSGLQFTPPRTDAKSGWVEEVGQRRGDNLAAVALAATPARILWAVLSGGQEYQVAA